MAMNKSPSLSIICTILICIHMLFISYRLLSCNAGVTGLTKYVRYRYKTCWKPLKINQYSKTNSNLPLKNIKPLLVVDHLCIDMNQLLHYGTRKLANTTHFMAKVYKRLDEILYTIQPEKSLVLAYDGSAPFAKMQTQRIRRTTSSSASMITPGTDFMNSILDYTMCYILQRLHRLTYNNITTFISSPTSPGEGELKIIDWIHTKMTNLNDSIVLCGSDSDMFIQTLQLVNRPNVFIFQNGNQELSDGICNTTHLFNAIVRDMRLIKSNKSYSREFIENYIQDDVIRQDLSILFLFQGNDYLPKLRGSTIMNTISAYSLSMASLPRESRFLYNVTSKSFNFAALWKIMHNLRSYVNNASVSSPPLQIATSIQYLYEYGQKHRINITERLLLAKNSLLIGIEIIFDNITYTSPISFTSKREARDYMATQILQSVNSSFYENILQRQQKTRDLLQQMKQSRDDNSLDDTLDDSLEDNDVSIDDRENPSVSKDTYMQYVRTEDVEHYLRGILWVLEMYKKGVCPDVSYTYSGRPPMSPYTITHYIESKLQLSNTDTLKEQISIQDLLRHANYQSLVDAIKIKEKPILPLSASATCLCVIPMNGIKYIPKTLRRSWEIMQSNFFHSKELNSYIRDSYSFDEMIDSLQQILKETQGITSESSIDERQRNRNRSRSFRKDDLIFEDEKNINNLCHSLIDSKDIYARVCDCFWTVVTSSSYFQETNETLNKYNGQYHLKPLQLPLKVLFTTPKQLSERVLILETEQTILREFVSSSSSSSSSSTSTISISSLGNKMNSDLELGLSSSLPMIKSSGASSQKIRPWTNVSPRKATPFINKKTNY